MSINFQLTTYRATIGRRLAAIAYVGVPLALSACGGGGVDDAKPSEPSVLARATFSIVWPEDSRLIPIAAKAVQIDVMQGAAKVASKAAARGAAGSTTVIDLENLPAANLTFVATALPNVSTSGTTTASGVPQATGSAPLKTEAGKTSKVTITMASTIVRLAVFPNPWKLEKLKPSAPARATAYDAQNRVVLTDPNRQFTWTSSNTTVLSVSPASGAVTPREKGFATLTVRDNESGKTATGQVEVVDEVPVDRVVVAPTTLNLEPTKTSPLTVKALDAEGNDLSYTPDKFTFTSSDPTRTTVGATGIVTGVAEGTATIEVKEKVTGKSGTCLVTVAALDTGRPLAYFNYGGLVGLRRIISSTQSEPIGFQPNTFRFGTRTGRRLVHTFATSRSETIVHVTKDDGSEDRVAYTSGSNNSLSINSNSDGSKLLVFETDSTNDPNGTRSLNEIDVATGARTPLPLPSALGRGGAVIAWSPDGDRYVVYSSDRTTALYDRRGQRVASLPYPVAHFSNDGEYLVTVQESGSGSSVFYQMQVRDKNGLLVASPPALNRSTYVRFHPIRNTILYRDRNSSTGAEQWIEMNLDGSNKKTFFSNPSELRELPSLNYDNDEGWPIS